MSESNKNVIAQEEETVATVAQQNAETLDPEGPGECEAERQEGADGADGVAESKEAKKLEKESAKLIRQAVAAFRKGTRGLLSSRVDTGHWCAEFFAWRAEHGFKDRAFSARLLFNALAVHADSERECDPNNLSKLYHAVQLLAPREPDGSVFEDWRDSGLTLGKLEALASLVFRAEGAETYAVLIREKEGDARALFLLACEEGEGRIGVKELAERALKLRDPEKAAQKAQEKGAKGATPPAATEDTPATLADAPAQEEGETEEEGDDDDKNPSDQRGKVSGNLLDPDTPYTSKDAAELATGILAKSELPDDALEALLLAVSKSAEFSKKAQRAAQAGIIVLTRRETTNPVNVAESLSGHETSNNGAPVGAA